MFSCFLFCIRHQGRAIAKEKLSTLTGTKREQYYEALQQLRNSDFSTSDFNLYGLLPEEDDDEDDDKPERMVKKPKQTKEKTLKGVRRSTAMDKTQPRFPQPMLRRQYYHPNSYVSLCDEGAKRVVPPYPLPPYATVYYHHTLSVTLCIFTSLSQSTISFVHSHFFLLSSSFNLQPFRSCYTTLCIDDTSSSSGFGERQFYAMGSRTKQSTHR